MVTVRFTICTSWSPEASWKITWTDTPTCAGPKIELVSPVEIRLAPLRSLTHRRRALRGRPTRYTPGGGDRHNPSMASVLTDTEMLEVERRARAALGAEPPNLTPEGGDRYALEAHPEVIAFIRGVGPPVVLRLAEEI